ncbi:MAG: C1 family peptidase [Pirellula sp.]
MAKSKLKYPASQYPGGGWAKDLHGNEKGWKRFRQTLNRVCPKTVSQYEQVVDCFGPIRNQGNRRTSTAFACLSVIEYFEHRVRGCLCERSKEFLYSITSSTIHRNKRCQDCTIRDTLRALSRFGAPPEIYWEYSPIGRKPKPKDPRLFSFAGDFLDLRYAKLDSADADGNATLKRVKKCLRLGIPIVFGYEVHWLSTPKTPFPISSPFYTPGWQSVVACGFDDEIASVLIRNSCGTEWGQGGYAWLPYAYIHDDHAADFWVVWKDEWMNRIYR